jgi:hypothetical protein
MVDQPLPYWCYLCAAPKPKLQSQCLLCGGWPTASFRPDVDEDTVKRLHANESVRVERW